MPNDAIRSLNLFSEPVHQPFKLQGGGPAALLIHGFMGSPAEMKPLARALNGAGWTVEGLRLPGFADQIDTLFEQRALDWRSATVEAVETLRASHQPVIILGYSMGAAVALAAASQTKADALILIAPFWKVGNRLHRLIWQALKRIFPNPRPFKKADFSDKRQGEFVGGLLPELDLTDPEVQDVLRNLRVPTRFVDQIFRIGKAGEAAASELQLPALFIQGRADQAIEPARTRQLISRYGGPVTYHEIDGDHGLVAAENPAFQQLLTATLAFMQLTTSHG